MKNTIASVLAGFMSVSMAGVASAEQIWVTMDQVRPYELKDAADSIIVGNPGIVDITVLDANNFFLFGKAPGLTNILVQDEMGEIVKNLQVRVNPPSSGMLVYHRGKDRTTYNCTRHCEVTLTVGDGNDAFTNVDAQVRQKLGQPQTGSEPPDLQAGGAIEN